jgi:hypothetical protein
VELIQRRKVDWRKASAGKTSLTQRSVKLRDQSVAAVVTLKLGSVGHHQAASFLLVLDPAEEGIRPSRDLSSKYTYVEQIGPTFGLSME